MLETTDISDVEHVEDVKFVINFDFPNNSEDYVHRIGRTGRSKRTGTAYTFFTRSNAKQAAELVSVLKEANQSINPKLESLAENFRGGIGVCRRRGGGFRNRGGRKSRSRSPLRRSRTRSPSTIKERDREREKERDRRRSPRRRSPRRRSPQRSPSDSPSPGKLEEKRAQSESDEKRLAQALSNILGGQSTDLGCEEDKKTESMPAVESSQDSSVAQLSDSISRTSSDPLDNQVVPEQQNSVANENKDTSPSNLSKKETESLMANNVGKIGGPEQPKSLLGSPPLDQIKHISPTPDQRHLLGMGLVMNGNHPEPRVHFMSGPPPEAPTRQLLNNQPGHIMGVSEAQRVGQSVSTGTQGSIPRHLLAPPPTVLNGGGLLPRPQEPAMHIIGGAQAHGPRHIGGPPSGFGGPQEQRFLIGVPPPQEQRFISTHQDNRQGLIQHIDNRRKPGGPFNQPPHIIAALPSHEQHVGEPPRHLLTLPPSHEQPHFIPNGFMPDAGIYLNGVQQPGDIGGQAAAFFPPQQWQQQWSGPPLPESILFQPPPPPPPPS